ncbi:MAG: CDGSH iron-sulfur domain-containing protein [Rubrobacteraceae bacterium]
MSRRDYRSESITVSFDTGRCIHAKECVNNLPEVFDVEKRPWIQPDESDPDTVARVVMRCPTGALQFTREDGGDEEQVPEENIVIVAKDGPLYIRGDIEMKEHDGSILLQDTRVALCRCGESRNKPFCDNSHKNSGFRDSGSLDDGLHAEATDNGGGKLEIKLTPNGPLFLKGEFEIRDAKDVTARRESKAALCRCGHSGNKPFCDGSHGGIGWRDY